MYTKSTDVAARSDAAAWLVMRSLRTFLRSATRASKRRSISDIEATGCSWKNFLIWSLSHPSTQRCRKLSDQGSTAYTRAHRDANTSVLSPAKQPISTIVLVRSNQRRHKRRNDLHPASLRTLVVGPGFRVRTLA